MRVAVNGVVLNVERVGDGHPLLLLHGFTGSLETWRPLLPAFARHRSAIAVDLLGHGGSDAPTDPERYRMERCVEDLLALLDALGVERADVLGYSMGGRVGLHLAAAAPGRVSALVVESASPGLADPAERHARARDDEALAEAIERDGVAAFVERWERLPLFASQAALPEDARARLRQQRLAHTPWGLANSLRGLGVGVQEPLWSRLPGLALPALVVVGDLDDKYREIGRRMASAMPRARLVVVPGAGHAVHLERPEVFGAAVLGFLLDPRRGEAGAPSQG